eukprot:13349073-Ditylum_brightwellii.AAC.2
MAHGIVLLDALKRGREEIDRVQKTRYDNLEENKTDRRRVQIDGGGEEEGGGGGKEERRRIKADEVMKTKKKK